MLKLKNTTQIRVSNLIYENCFLFGDNSSLTAKKINKYLLGTRHQIEIFKCYELRYLLLRIAPLIQTMFKTARAPLTLTTKGTENKKLPFWKKEHGFNTTSPNKPPQMLFATITPAFAGIVEHAAKICQMPYHQERWLNGSITGAISYLFDHNLWRHAPQNKTLYFFRQHWSQNKESWSKSEERARYAQRSRWPSLVIIPDIINNSMILSEVQKVGLPVIGLVSSNCSVEIEYPIFAQDQGFSSVHFFCHFLATLITKEMIFWTHRAYIKRNVSPRKIQASSLKKRIRIDKNTKHLNSQSKNKPKQAIDNFLFESYLPSKNGMNSRTVIRQRRHLLYAMHLLELETDKQNVASDHLRKWNQKRVENLRLKIKQKLRKWQRKQRKLKGKIQRVCETHINVAKQLPKIRYMVELLQALAKKNTVASNRKLGRIEWKVKPKLEFLQIVLNRLHPGWDFEWNEKLKEKLWIALNSRKPSVWPVLDKRNALFKPEILRQIQSYERRWERRIKYRFWVPKRRLFRLGRRIRSAQKASRRFHGSKNLRRKDQVFNFSFQQKEKKQHEAADAKSLRGNRAKPKSAIWVKATHKVQVKQIFRKVKIMNITRFLGRKLNRAEKQKKSTSLLRSYCRFSKSFWLGPRFKNLWQLQQKMLKKKKRNSSPPSLKFIQKEEKEKSLIASADQSMSVNKLLQNFLRMPKQTRTLWKTQFKCAPLFKLTPTLYHEWSSTAFSEDLKWFLHKHITPPMRDIRLRKRLKLAEIVRKKFPLKTPSSFSRVKKPWKTKQHWQKWMQQSKWDFAAAYREKYKNANWKKQKKNWNAPSKKKNSKSYFQKKRHLNNGNQNSNQFWQFWKNKSTPKIKNKKPAGQNLKLKISKTRWRSSWIEGPKKPKTWSQYSRHTA